MKKIAVVCVFVGLSMFAVGQAQVEHQVKSARESGSGMATGKKADAQHLKSDGIVHRDLATRQPAPESTPAPREAGSGMATGKRQSTAQEQMQSKPRNKMQGAQSNPLYKDDGKSGTNPMYEGSQRNGGSADADNGDSSDPQTKAGVSTSRSNVRSGGSNVATGDVDGDGAAERTATKTRSNIQNNRTTATESSEPAKTREAGTGMATGKRQHAPAKVQPPQ